jgi:TDG/mug DNA glycosylase family protein
MRQPPTPTAAELAAAFGRTIPDLIAPDLDVLFCGINPGLYSAATRCHFARPGNRFWPALHAAGFTPRVLKPWEKDALLACGCGVTNLVARGTATAAELDDDELRAGRRRLARKVARYRPRAVAIVGIGAYRVGFDRPKATLGLQPDRLAGAHVWVLPNTSGLNANHRPADFGRAFGELRRFVQGERNDSPGRSPGIRRPAR